MSINNLSLRAMIIECLRENKKEMTIAEIFDWIVEYYSFQPEKSRISTKLVESCEAHTSLRLHPKFYEIKSESKTKYGLLEWKEEDEEDEEIEEIIEEIIEETIEEEPKYTVYMRKMKPTGKYYIGITKDTPEIRAGETGEKYKYNKAFDHDIRMYGWINVETKIYRDNLSREEALKEEHDLIEFFDSTNPDKGYNQKK